jgi:hypothetical protein
VSAWPDLSAYPPPAYRPAPDRRPGVVTAAAIVSIVLSALVLCVGLIVLVAGLSGAEPLLDDVRRGARGGYDNYSDAHLHQLLMSLGGVLSLWCTAAIGCAVLVLRRSNVGRVLLAMSAVVTALASLVRIGSVVSIVPLLGAVAVVVLLFVGGANDWFFRAEPPEEPRRS